MAHVSLGWGAGVVEYEVLVDDEATGSIGVCSRGGGSLRPPSAFTSAYRDLLGRRSIPTIWFHDLRHSHASELLRAGVSPKVISERFGQSNVGSTLEIYGHIVPGMEEEALISDHYARKLVWRREGIRYVTASMPSATYRFHIAAPTVDANVAMAPCPILPDRNTERLECPASATARWRSSAHQTLGFREPSCEPALGGFPAAPAALACATSIAGTS
jgi:hypothetical protein